MPEINSDASIVEVLRSKVEESDIKQYLKSTLGGYSRRSVLDYLNLLRKQQHATQDTFVRNQQQLFEEKENLRKANDVLKTKLERAENNYCELSDSIKIHEIENSDITPSDVSALKSKISMLEDELNKSDSNKKLLVKQLEHQKSAFDDLAQELERSAQEKVSLKELIKAEVKKEKELSSVISRLSGTIAERDEEISFLNPLLSEGQVAELTSKVNELTEQILTQGEMLITYNSESGLQQQTIEALLGENETLKQRIAELSRNSEELSSQSIKHLAACKALTEQLESEYKRSIALIKERSAATVARLEAVRKLDEADSKLALLELQLKKQNASADTDAVYESAAKTDRMKPEYEDIITSEEVCS
jgi:chromosome segregation ATPase